MKIFIICSKRFYDKIPEIKAALEAAGHQITLPNAYDDQGSEERYWNISKEAHAEWKGSMLKQSRVTIGKNDAVLVLNFLKDEIENYIGGATFLEVYEAFIQNKKIYLYNPIPEGMLFDEIQGLSPEIINGDLSKIK